MTQTTDPSAQSAEEQRLIDSATEPGPGVEALATTDDQPTPEPAEPTQAKPDTRERILDVALDLFTEQGFDGTSLREIAERLGVTKAALYYHFESKDDILLALHMRMHEFGKQALLKMGDEPVTLAQWGELIDEMVDSMLAQRPLFLMHERNQAALEKLHKAEHDAEHEDIQNQFRRVLSDTRIPLEDRVRMAASFGVLFSGLLLSGDSFSSSTNGELGGLLRRILHDVLGG